MCMIISSTQVIFILFYFLVLFMGSEDRPVANYRPPSAIPFEKNIVFRADLLVDLKFLDEAPHLAVRIWANRLIVLIEPYDSG